MDYQADYRVDLDPAHSVIRLTVTAEIVTLELAEDIYRHLSEVTSQGGPVRSHLRLIRGEKKYDIRRGDQEFRAPRSRCPRGENPRGGGQRAIDIRISPYVSTI